MPGEQPKAGAGPGAPDRLSDLKSRVDSVGRLLDQLEDARTAARRTRIGVIIVILLVFVGYGWIMYQEGRRLVKEDLPKVQAELQQSMMTVGASALDELVGMARRVGPVYRDTLQTKLQERWPEMKEKFTAEAEKFTGNLADATEARLKAKLNAMAARQKEKFIAAFPILTDDKKVDLILTNLEDALRGATVDVLQARVDQGEERLRAVYEKILQFLPEDRAGHEDRMRKAWDQFLLFDLKGMERSK